MANKYTKTPSPPKDELEKMYHSQGMTQGKIGEVFKVSQKVVWRWFRDLEIKTRVPKNRNQHGENNHAWKGDEATYAAFHYRVESARGKPNYCTVCGSIDKTKLYEWANLTGNYSDITDYARMCRKCHRRYDKNRPNSSKDVKRTAK